MCIYIYIYCVCMYVCIYMCVCVISIFSHPPSPIHPSIISILPPAILIGILDSQVSDHGRMRPPK